MPLNWGQYIFNLPDKRHLLQMAQIKYILSPIKWSL
jgi:hypothetical protein